MASQTPAPQHFRIRPARRGDAPGIVAILSEIGSATDSATVAWIISHPEMELLVAADPLDKVIGMITLSHRPLLKAGGRAAVIDELVVTLSWRRRGIGRELLKRVVERAKVLTVKRLEIESFEAPSEGVIAFFRACAFEQSNVGVFRLK